MLDDVNGPQMMDMLLDGLECRAQLPESWSDFFDRRGALPTIFDDRRRFPRFHYRGRAVMEFDKRAYCVYTKNISRCGICFLHFEQLFPLQQGQIWLPWNVRVAFEVTRCVRAGKNCYECGTQFIREEDRATVGRHLVKDYGTAAT